METIFDLQVSLQKIYQRILLVDKKSWTWLNSHLSFRKTKLVN